MILGDTQEDPILETLPTPVLNRLYRHPFREMMSEVDVNVLVKQYSHFPSASDLSLRARIRDTIRPASIQQLEKTPGILRSKNPL